MPAKAAISGQALNCSAPPPWLPPFLYLRLRPLSNSFPRCFFRRLILPPKIDVLGPRWSDFGATKRWMDGPIRLACCPDCLPPRQSNYIAYCLFNTHLTVCLCLSVCLPALLPALSMCSGAESAAKVSTSSLSSRSSSAPPVSPSLCSAPVYHANLPLSSPQPTAPTGGDAERARPGTPMCRCFRLLNGRENCEQPEAHLDCNRHASHPR